MAYLVQSGSSGRSTSKTKVIQTSSHECACGCCPYTSLSVSARPWSAITNHNNHRWEGREDSASPSHTPRDQQLCFRQLEHYRCSRCLQVSLRGPSPSRVPSRNANLRLPPVALCNSVMPGPVALEVRKTALPARGLDASEKYKLGGPRKNRVISTVTTSLEITSNLQLCGRAPTPGPRGRPFTSSAQRSRSCASRWRPCVEELTHWRNVRPPRLEQDHFCKSPHKQKASCPSLRSCWKVPACSRGSQQRTSTICWTLRSENESAARVHRDFAPLCDSARSCGLVLESRGR